MVIRARTRARLRDMESRGEKEYATEVQQLTKNRYISTERSAPDTRAVTFRKNISRFPWLWSLENNRFKYAGRVYVCVCVRMRARGYGCARAFLRDRRSESRLHVPQTLRGG